MAMKPTSEARKQIASTLLGELKHYMETSYEQRKSNTASLQVMFMVTVIIFLLILLPIIIIYLKYHTVNVNAVEDSETNHWMHSAQDADLNLDTNHMFTYDQNLNLAHVFFAHIHKAGGNSVYDILETVPYAPYNGKRCDWWDDHFNTQRYIASSIDDVGVRKSPIDAYAVNRKWMIETKRWWHTENPDCSALDSERVGLGGTVDGVHHQCWSTTGCCGILYHCTNEEEQNQKMWDPADEIIEPSLMTIYRHPISRCRSHWRQRLDRVSRMAGKEQLTETEGNAKNFTDVACNEWATRRFFLSVEYNPDTEEIDPKMILLYLQQHRIFFGVLELFNQFVCLIYWYSNQREKFYETCSCDMMDVFHENKGTEKSADSMYELPLSDEYIASLNKKSIELYDVIRAIFELRVREVEIKSGVRILCDDDT